MSLGVMGLWLIDEAHNGMLGSWWVSMSAGIVALAGAQIVFLICIADRIFPRTHQTLSRTIEGGLGAIFLGAGGVLAVSSILGWVGA